MAKRYELPDEAWTVVADLFTETHGRGRSRPSDRLMLDGVLWVLCSGALRAERCRIALARGQRHINDFGAGESREHSIRSSSACT